MIVCRSITWIAVSIILLGSTIAGTPPSQSLYAPSLPVIFQRGDNSSYVGRLPGVRVRFDPGGVTFSKTQASFRMQFLGANVGAKPTGQTAYARWHSIRADKESLVESGEIFESVAYRDIFPGIDLVWRAGPEGLKSEYLVHAGSEPSIIRFQYDGETPRVESGTLVIGDSRSQLREHEPYVYQEIGGVRVQVKAGYRILESGVVTFEIGEFDRSQPLTIDPDFDFSTVWGGSMFDSITSVAIGPDGSVYACGWTESSDLPVRNAYQPAISHPLDAFVMKMTPSNALVYATFLGGSGQDRANAIAVDSTGSAYVTGTTGSPDFPISANAAQKKLKGYSNGFVVKLSADGSKLLYSTYLGGSGTDVATAIQLDATSIYIAGSTSSDDFPIRNGFQTGRAGLSDGFILRLDASTGSISYGSYLGGSADDQILAMCVSNGKIYMTGSTKSADFPVLRPFQANLKGGQNAFVTVLDESSSSLVYSTFLGGSSGTLPEQANGIAVDSIGRAFIAGITPSLDFPVPPGWQPNLAGASDGFVVRLSADGSTIDAGTYFGGSDFDNATALALDAEQHVYVVGYTSSWDFPVTQGSSTPAGTFNLFVSTFSPALDRLEFSTLWGGSGPDSVVCCWSRGRRYKLPLPSWARHWSFPCLSIAPANASADITRREYWQKASCWH